MPVTIYGITNCTTMQKARAWLEEHDIPYAFHDYRKAGAPLPLLEGWAAKLGWEKLLNRSGLTWRRLSDAEKAGVDGPHALELMQAKPTLIRRPVLDRDGDLLVGFRPDAWAAAFGTEDARP